MQLLYGVLVLLALAGPACGRGWLGVRFALARGPFATPPGTFAVGLEIEGPVIGSPAERAGLARGDVIVAATGVAFDGPPEKLEQRFLDAIGRAQPGDALALSVVRRRVERAATLGGKPISGPGLFAPGRLLERAPPGTTFQLTARAGAELLAIHVTLAARPDARPPLPLQSVADVFPRGLPTAPVERRVRALITAQGADAGYARLVDELRRQRPPDDRFRLSRERFAYEHPLELPAVAHQLAADLVAPPGAFPPLHALAAAAEWLDQPLGALPRVWLAPAGVTVAQRLDEVEDVLRQAKRHLDRAFARLSVEEQDFVAAHEGNLTRTLARHIYLGDDVARSAVPDHQRMVELLERVDRAELCRAAAVLLSFADQSRGAFREDLAHGLTVPELRRDTAFGPIVVGGPGHNWYHEDYAVIIDLGGNDFYTCNAGGARGRARPLALVIDYAGDDAYESTTDFSQGAGLLGVGVLVDFGGHDSYVAPRWSQGAGLAGVGVLFDASGNDAYHGQDFVQAAALGGVGLLVDAAGDDTYDATRFAQGCALPGAFAALVESSGRDTYYAKGRYQTSYGDRGLFDSFSQGCALGFRDVAAGGIAVLADYAGDDRYEAGHFSQGGGYYHGFGLLSDAQGNDWYMGSRYAQGFAAHAAVGCLEDGAGNDTYGTRQCVAQGIAWDHCVVAFLDHGGDDVYEGGDVSSQGYAAYSSFCLFFDESGNDTYRYVLGPGTTGPNDAVPSLAVFLDGGGHDVYPPAAPGNGRTVKRGQVGIIADVEP